MQNHGLVVAADTTAEIRALTDEVVRKITRALHRARCPGEERPVADAVARLLPALRMLLSEPGVAEGRGGARTARWSSISWSPENRRDRRACPSCRTTSCTASPRRCSSTTGTIPRKLLASFPAALEAYRRQWGYPPKMILASGIGRRGGGGHQALRGDLPGRVRGPHEGELALRELRRAALPRPARHPVHRHLGGGELPPARGQERRLRSGRVEGKIALVTGAAQGFGKGIAEGLFREGANVVIADLNETAGRALPKRAERGGRAVGSGQPGPVRAAPT